MTSSTNSGWIEIAAEQMEDWTHALWYADGLYYSIMWSKYTGVPSYLDTIGPYDPLSGNWCMMTGILKMMAKHKIHAHEWTIIRTEYLDDELSYEEIHDNIVAYVVRALL